MTERNLPHRPLSGADSFAQQKPDPAWPDRGNILRLLCDHLPTAVAIFDRDMRYLEANRHWVEDHRLGQRDLLGKRHYEIFPEIPERWRQIHRRALDGEVFADQEERIERADGSVQWLHWQVWPWYAAPDRIGGILILRDDISRRKEAELALQHEREVFRNLAEIASDFFWETDDQFRFRMISPSIARRSRIDFESYLGKTRWELPFVGISPEQWRAHRNLLAAHQPFRDLEGGLANMDGEVRWFVMSGDPVFDLNGKFTGYRGVSKDISERLSTLERLRQSEARYWQLFEHMNTGFVLFEVVVDAQGVPADLIILAANRRFEATTGLNRQHAIGKRLTEALPGIEQDDADWIGTYGKIALTGVPREFEQRSDLLGNVYAVSAYQPASGQCAVTFQDITARKAAEADLRIAAVAFQVQEGIMVTDSHARILKVNPSLTRITGYSPQECIGRTPKIFSSGRQDRRFYQEMWKCINASGRWEGELWNRRKNGERYPAHMSITAVHDEHGQVSNYIGNFSDITMSLAAAEEIRGLAFYDPLTHLPNRRLFLDRLHQAMASSARSGQKGALLLLDLDNFKTINDTLGHDMGDSLLQQVAERILHALRDEDTVGRLGGDEFVVLVSNLGADACTIAEKAQEVGDKLLSALNRPFRLGDVSHHNTPSIGVTIFSGSETAEELMKQSDLAMYHAKRSGKNTLCFFDPPMQDAVNAHATRERDLRIAIDQRQFELYYQVQVDRTGKPIGAEALIRWNHPTEGLVSPASFIPIAEESSLIVDIGDWVIDAACAQLAAWNRDPATRHLILSINVSSRQIRHPGFVDKIGMTIARHGVDVAQIELEITESMLIEDTESTTAVMDRLHAKGIRLTLDDFGTGYSSLSYLKRLPIGRIKIDQSFVREMAADPHDLAIIRTIIAMADNLRIDTIAEGIETDDQRQLLVRSGCMAFQGYWFGRPKPLDDFERSILLQPGAPTPGGSH